MACNVLGGHVMTIGHSPSLKPQFAGWKGMTAPSAVSLGMPKNGKKHRGIRPLKAVDHKICISLEDMQAVEAQKHGDATYVLVRNDLGFPVEYVTSYNWYGFEYAGLPYPRRIQNGQVASFLHQANENCEILCECNTEKNKGGLVSVGAVVYRGISADVGGKPYYFIVGWSNGDTKQAFTDIRSSVPDKCDWEVIENALNAQCKLRLCKPESFSEGESIISAVMWDHGETIFQKTSLTVHFKRHLLKGTDVIFPNVDPPFCDDLKPIGTIEIVGEPILPSQVTGDA